MMTATLMIALMFGAIMLVVALMFGCAMFVVATAFARLAGFVTASMRATLFNLLNGCRSGEDWFPEHLDWRPTLWIDSKEKKRRS